MPLTDLQREILAVLAPARAGEGYLAGGAALHISPNSTRYSHDVDFFHDSSRRTARAYEADILLLAEAGYAVEPAFSQPGFIRAIVSLGEARTQIDWAHDSAWRFLPLVKDEFGLSLLEQLRRSGRFRPDDIARLDLAQPFDLQGAKRRWLAALADAEAFVTERPPAELGCLYYAPERERFEAPSSDQDLAAQGLVAHFGRPGGVLPVPRKA